ncbi:MAG TPA: hypothetical protein VN688_18870 [Gemmataceae bacterium]|nr:hypothetical protein [Gemmataceae bacterium]
MTEIQQLQSQLTTALDRIQHLEEEMNGGKVLLRWQYLIARPHRWRRQLSIKGRNMTVGHLVSTIGANRYTPEQASEELELPLATIYEALMYYAENRDLIEMEAGEERRRLAERGYSLEPKNLPR